MYQGKKISPGAYPRGFGAYLDIFASSAKIASGNMSIDNNSITFQPPIKIMYNGRNPKRKAHINDAKKSKV